MRPEFYFDRFEHRQPPEPVPYSPLVETLWQIAAIANIIAGAIYITWRWTSSLNYDALWFSVPLAVAETCAWFGLILFTANLWKTRDYPKREPPAKIADCVAPDEEPGDRCVSIDLFIATYNEEEELVRLSIQDAKAIQYPHEIDFNIYVLDDGRRATMRAVCDEEGVGYISRDNNIGFKAGNLRNAMEQTSGDFIAICDADTRPLPTMFERMLGYFRDPDVAVVQSPQWFYDIPEGERLPDVWGRRAGPPGRYVAKAIEAVFGEIRVGEDPFANDPALFYDIIQRRRNAWNAAFCCGAGSIHRREAVMFVALQEFAEALTRDTAKKRSLAALLTRREREAKAMTHWQTALAEEVTPYKFHVSEDIYSTIVLHQSTGRRWKTVLHPSIESKMLSPQDLLSWTIQRFKYAGGSLDIFFRDNPVTKPGMTLPQRIMYLATFWSYLGALWNLMFLAAPLVYMFFAIPPVSAYTGDFFAHALPFLVLNELAFMLGTWGLSGYKGKVMYLASFPLSLRALWAVMRKRKISFPVTPKQRQEGNFLSLVWPQVAVIALTLAGFAWSAFQLARGHGGYSVGGLIANGLWGLNNILAMSIMVQAAFWKPEWEKEGAS